MNNIFFNVWDQTEYPTCNKNFTGPCFTEQSAPPLRERDKERQTQINARKSDTFKNTSMILPYCSMISKNDLILFIFLSLRSDPWTSCIWSMAFLTSFREVISKACLCFALKRTLNLAKARWKASSIIPAILEPPRRPEIIVVAKERFGFFSPSKCHLTRETKFGCIWFKFKPFFWGGGGNLDNLECTVYLQYCTEHCGVSPSGKTRLIHSIFTRTKMRKWWSIQSGGSTGSLVLMRWAWEWRGRWAVVKLFISIY